MIFRACIAGCLAGLLGACGGGAEVPPSNSTVEPVVTSPVTANTREQSTALLIAYLSSANDTKYQQYQAATTANRVTYATSVGARVTGNSALYVANKLAFETAVRSFSSGFLSRLEQVSKTHPIDAPRLVLELDSYQKNDVDNLTQLSVSSGFSVDVSVVNGLYETAKTLIRTYN